MWSSRTDAFLMSYIVAHTEFSLQYAGARMNPRRLQILRHLLQRRTMNL